MTWADVPFQPNVNLDGTPNPLAGKDDAILYGATVPDPGGLPLGTLESITFSRFFNVGGVSFQATVHAKSGSGTLPAGTVALNVPAGWTVEAAKPIGPISDSAESTATFTITPSASAAVNTNFRISALLTTGGKTGYTDNVVRIVPPVEGRFQRWGNWAEYDSWVQNVAPQALRLGRSAAVQTTGVGETFTLPVVVHNWSDSTQSGTVTLTLPSGLTADATSKPYGPLAAGADTTVNFSVSNTFTNSTLPITGTAGGQQNTNVSVRITTSFGSGSGFEDLTLGIVPKTAIPAAAAAPAVDAVEGAGEYTGEALDVGRKWEPGGDTRNCDPLGVDCGSSTAPGTPTSTYAKVTRFGDDLYFFIHVRDDFQSYAVTPAECVAHWLADSVEILIDPRGNGSQNLLDTGAAFKLGVFPFTNDPTGSNGNGVNGPCWERDADNHQGYATGPLAATVDDAPNAPGVQVASSATWVGSNSTTVDHGYGTAGGYNLEVKIPMADLPAAVDPEHMGLNITPYDEDDTSAAGTTTLRHIDQSTRLAWSTFGSVQSDPYRWGHATLPGYTPPAGRPTTTEPPNVSHPNLDGVLSPQTIYQSAQDGVPISGRPPAPAGDSISPSSPTLGPSAFTLDLVATGAGTAHVYLWAGDHGAIPVFLSSCAVPTDPVQIKDYGLSACAPTDGGIPPWSPDMSGRVVRALDVPISGAGTTHVSIPLDAAAYEKLAGAGSALVSFETANDEVQALALGLAQAPVTVAQSAATSFQNDPVTLTATVAATNALFPGTPTGQVQFTVDDVALGSPVALDAQGVATLTTTELPTGTHQIRAVYLGDADYAKVTSSAIEHVTKGVAEQLDDLSDLIDSFNLKKGKSNKFENTVANISKQYDRGLTKQVCQQLDSLVKKAQKESGRSLTASQSRQLVEAATRISTLVGC
jgi:hypothetical protein